MTILSILLVCVTAALSAVDPVYSVLFVMGWIGSVIAGAQLGWIRVAPLVWRVTCMTRCFTLPLGNGVELRVWAEDSGRTWNGFAAPILTAAQAIIVGDALHVPDFIAGESSGLTWEIDPSAVCPACGMPHTAEHSCEPITWGSR